ncbi:MAG: hypothetical protein H0V60_08765 [Actinobacteria bacterium]|nr:hypothetical protein [Actinomycetota bacterium]
MFVERSLSHLSDRLERARQELRIADEQLLFQLDVVEDTRTRMLVAETPIADGEYRVAQRDYDLLLRERDRVKAQIADLQAEQDRLLDRLLG